MTKLEAVLKQARGLPSDRQDSLAEQIALWLAEPEWPEPPDETSTIGSDEELARRIAALEANPVGVAPEDLFARLAAKRKGP